MQDVWRCVEGEALKAKAITDNTTRDPEEIYVYISEPSLFAQESTSLSAERLSMNNQSMEEDAKIELDHICTCIDPIA